MRGSLVLLALAIPLEGHTSGSSTVIATGAHLAVSLESPRKIFDMGQGEQEWHAEWVAAHQPEVDAALAKVEPVLSARAAAEGLTLAPWSDTLPEAWPGVPAEHPYAMATVCAAGPCAARLQLWDCGVTGAPWLVVAVAVPPGASEEALKRIGEAMARALVP